MLNCTFAKIITNVELKSLQLPVFLFVGLVLKNFFNANSCIDEVSHVILLTLLFILTRSLFDAFKSVSIVSFATRE